MLRTPWLCGARPVNTNIEQFDLTVLEDGEDFFLPYNPVPLVNGDTVDEYDIEEPLNEVSQSLTSEEEVMELNVRIDIEGEDAQDVAREYLEENGLITSDGSGTIISTFR